jgi:glycine/D-amino acid oxidase-like deaminating enzyme
VTDPRRELCFWFDSMESLPEYAPPPWREHVQVAIVGAGYTGLWTAYYLKQLEPALDIAIYEAEHVGFGASGRNGGWCLGLAWGLEGLLANEDTRSRGRALAAALFDTVDEVGRVCQAENIDAHYAKGGSLNVATVPYRAAAMQRELEHLHALGFGDADYEWLPPEASRRRLNMRPNHGALLFHHCAAVHPARLVLGLLDAVRRRGVTIHEHTPVQAIEPGRLRTSRGSVSAGVVLRATEGYSASLRGEARSILPIYSMVTATEPLPADLWREIGLERRETFGDGRRVVIYGQRTLDDRLVFGGRGGYYFGSKRKRTVDADEPRLARVKALIPELFPMLKGVHITHAWGGLMGVQRHWRPGVCFDRATGLGWAGGYVGEGVAASNLAARILADLVTDRSTSRTALPWVGDRARSWEPEPLRWLGAKVLERAAERADEEELTHDRPSRFWGRVFDNVIG